LSEIIESEESGGKDTLRVLGAVNGGARLSALGDCGGRNSSGCKEDVPHAEPFLLPL